MTATFPFLTSYDPPGTSEGTFDPLGLYQIADQLAMQLVTGRSRTRLRTIRRYLGKRECRTKATRSGRNGQSR